MAEITDFNFAEDDFTAADLAKFELIKSEENSDLNNLAELLNQAVAAKVAKVSQEKDEFYGKQLASKDLESDIFYKHFPCGYFSTDGNGIINKINDTLLVWLGYANEDIIGKVTWQSLLSVGGKMYFETHYSPLLQMQGFVQEISFEMVKKDKTRLPILINTKQIRDENGKVQINFSTVFDVSQRKSYEKELLIAKRTAEDQNELIEYTFRNASTPIYYVLEDASIYDFNDIAAENLGYTSEELHTLKIYDLDINYDEKKWASVWAKLKAEKKITVETQHKKKDGSLLDVIITANYVKYGDIELKCSYVQDVTEKKKQEKELKLVDFTFNNSAMPIFLVNEDSSIYNINEAAAKGLGFSQEELKGKKIIEIDDNFDKDKWAIHWADVKAKGSITIETTHTKKDGTISDLIININYLKHGDLELLCSYAIDITEKKKLEQQLNLLDYSYKHTNSAMFFLDVDGLYIDFNQSTANLLGYSCEEFRGKTVLDVNPMLTKESWVNRWEELKDVPNQNFQVKLKRKDGTLIDVAVTTNSIEINDKIVNFGFYEDITEKKKVAEDLRLMDFAFEKSATPIILLLATGEFYSFNDALLNLLGYSKEEFSKMNLLDVATTMDQASCIKQWDKIIAKKNTVFDCHFERKDGVLLDVEVSANLINYNDNEVNFCYIKDITEKKKLEDNLKLSAFTIDNAAWGLAYVKADGTLYNCNLAFAKIYGSTSLEEMKTKTTFDFGSPYTTETWKQYWDELKQKKSLHYIVKRTKKDGTIIDLEINANMIQFGDLELNCIYVNDVTEKIKAEDDLKQVNKRYEYATLATSDIIWEADLLKNEAFISKNFTTIFGHPVSDGWMPIENDIWRQNINPDDIDFLMEDQYAVLNSKESNNKWVGEYRLKKADGSYATVKDRTFAIKDEDGKIIRMVGAMQDITQQRLEEERLRLMESVILNTKDSILITEAEPVGEPGPRILFVNPAFEKMTGYTPEEIIGLTPRILQNEDTDRKELDKLRIALDKWEPCEITISNSRKNGEKFWNNFSVAPVANEKGWYTHWIAVERDVTKEKKEEERLRLMESVILKTNDSVIVTEANSISELGHAIVFVNDAFCKTTGYSKEEVIGKDPRMLQCEETDRKELDKFKEKMGKWETAEMTILNKKKNGDKFWATIVATPLADEKGIFTHWIGVQRDVTEEIEAALEKEKMMEELLENNSDLKQFGYITTHNLRAPLTNLILICKLISREKIENPSTLKLIEGFKTSTYQLNETLNDLINVLIIKQKTNLPLNQLSFEEIINKVKESISETLSNSKAIIEIDFSDVPTVHFTKVYLESIFLNLITNSIKYRHPQRNPIVNINTIKDAMGRTKLTFSDNGIGMDMSRVKHKIFGFHQRFHKNADSKGVGLFLIKSQINALGGEIEVASELNIGTTFTITFKEPIT